MSYHDRDITGFVNHRPDGLHHLDLAVTGIECAACLRRVEDGLSRLDGVTKVRANLTNKRVAVEWQDHRFDPARILSRLDELGFGADPFDPGRVKTAEAEDARTLLKALAVAAFASMNVMLLSVSVWSGNVSDITPETRDLFHWLSAVIAIPAVAYAGQPFFRSAWRALSAGALNMDVPISLGVLLAVGLSLYETAHSASHAYFDSSVMLLTFLLAGRYLERSMRRQTRALAENLAALRADTVTLLDAAGGTRDVPLSKVERGNLVLVRPGERIAVDGVIENGASELDVSLVTGETAPQAVVPGENVFAGTLNGSGALKMRVLATADSSFLSEVSRLVENAAEARSRYVDLASAAARLYAPVVHATALLTLIGWLVAGAGFHQAIVIAISVLIITCPCALGLAVPAVRVVIAGRLFKSGVLLHTGDALERLAEIDMVVFDKTGTLTLPLPQIVNRGDVTDDIVMAAGRLAAASRHPLSIALARATGEREPLHGVIERTGEGVIARIDGVEWRLGAPAFCGAETIAAALAASHPNASLIAFRRGAETPAVFVLSQELRPEAEAVLAGLKHLGLPVEMMSGDRDAPVADLAARLGLSYRSGLKPADKVARLEELKAQGRRVLMVGDGLNDAPALAAAHASISPATAADVSQAAADAIFLGASLRPVLSAIHLARRARGLMVQNLSLSVIYNALAVPLAIAGFATPLIAALAMSGSSALVTLNAWRGRFGKIGDQPA